MFLFLTTNCDTNFLYPSNKQCIFVMYGHAFGMLIIYGYINK